MFIDGQRSPSGTDELCYLRRSDQELGKNQLRNYRTNLREHTDSLKITPIRVEFNPERMTKSNSINKNNIEDYLRNSETHIQNDGEPFITHILPTNPHVLRSEELKNDFMATHRKSLATIRGIFSSITERKRVSPLLLEKIIGEIVGGLIRDRELLCNLSHIDYAQEDYLFNHSLNVMIFSIHIGTQLGYKKEQ